MHCKNNTTIKEKLMGKIFLISLLFICFQQTAAAEQIRSGEQRPNILWLVIEDMSSHFAYQGEKLVSTPNVDKLANNGVNYSNAYVTAPVCSASRSAMITGMYQTSIGAHNHRSSRGKFQIKLQGDIKTLPEIFRDNGYFTSNMSFSADKPNKWDRYGKEDYNFQYDRKTLYDNADWSKKDKGQAFFAQIQLRGGKIRNVPSWLKEMNAGLDSLIKANQVTLPPYYPDHPVIRQGWADYLNSVQYTDMEVGLIIKRLEKLGDLENTVIIVTTDHGISHARGKQFLYDEGSRIPFIVHYPQKLKASTEDKLVAHIDMAATSLALANIAVPNWMQAKSIFNNEQQRSYVALARDRCDETVDRIRGIRMGNWKYIRNFHNKRPHLQPSAYKDSKPFMPVMRQLHKDGKLNATQALLFAPQRPAEELYNLDKDPFEINNLAGSEAHTAKLVELRKVLANWIIQTDDKGRFPESAISYDQSLEAYLTPRLRKKHPAQVAEAEKNIKLMKKWAADGI
ncbi:sulfatase [Colwelliaceae bacterium BS250]